MPFGAEYLSGGKVRFRLWAPAATRVELVLNKSILLMPRDDAGWFEMIVQAPAGSGYRFLINGSTPVPDPASRFQPEDVHGPSVVIDPGSFEWTDTGWQNRPWDEAVIYELHVGTFSASGTFAGVEERLDYLAELGVTAIELMPLSDFFGKRNWGYDGVLPYAPDFSYGHPDDLKRLIQAAHSRNLMVMLDVVYNHFGPEGNYLRTYAPQFFTSRHCTPWGDGINFDGPESRVVRDFFIHNALYWLEEFHFDGLRLDAVHAIQDESSPDILDELAETVRTTVGLERPIHLVLENDNNAAHYLAGRPPLYDAQWNDDIHHAGHVVVSGESDGYYLDYAREPVQALAKCLTEGFYFQGQPSEFREGKRRGESSSQLPLSRFISFLQNHDQVGNRAFGERILSFAMPEAVRAIMGIFLLAPSPPLLFMGEEFAADSPFLYFCDFEPDLARAVATGRRNEFARFAQFRDPAARNSIPDPNAESTFLRSKLEWKSCQEPRHAEWLQLYSRLLRVRQQEIVPFLRGGDADSMTSTYRIFETSGLSLQWQVASQTLHLIANLSDKLLKNAARPAGRSIYSSKAGMDGDEIPAWSIAWYRKS
jgi:maltooligosyltrehalose trehalohydrolase